MSEPIRVLIVDDDVPTRIGLRAILGPELDLEVAGEAADGREACALAESLAPDIVLMDVQLPDIDGIEATRRIVSADGATEPPRVIVLTTFELDDYVFRSLRAGASGFLLKRTRAEDLVDAIRVVAGGEALPAPELTRRLIAGSVDASGGRSNVASWSLTDREREVLVHVARGLSNQDIAEHLHLSTETVRTHVKRMYVKMGVHDRAQAVIAAYENGVVSTGR
jgi:DNA-binding NarL/FixJ family response regulator